jgi:hypothetical protein
VNKADHEVAVFREFVEVAGLPVDPDSIRPAESPWPDISCTIAGQVHYFELTRAADQGIADNMGGLIVKGRRTGEGGVVAAQAYDDRSILRVAVERKASATHETGGQPLSLLVYYDGVFHALGSFTFIESTFRALQAQYHGRWNAIWLYDRNKKEVLA